MLNMQYVQLKQTGFMTQPSGYSAAVLGHLAPILGYSEQRGG
jgi:hypothetical protein